MTVEKDLVNRAANAKLPTEITDPHDYIRDANIYITSILSRARALPEHLEWNVVTPDAFARRAVGLTEVQKLGLFYLDHTHQAYVCAALSAWKAESMLRSAIRSLNTGELVAPALLSRALLEHATSTLVRLQGVIRLFQSVGESERPFPLPEDQMSHIETTLLLAIWGTRLGTSNVAKCTPLWAQSPYLSGEPIVVDSVAADFKTVALHAPLEGQIAFRVYEWLCDIVHPATQGLRLFWGARTDMAPGHQRFALERTGAPDQSVTHAIVLWGLGYASAVLAKTLDSVVTSVYAAESRLEPIYGLKLGEKT